MVIMKSCCFFKNVWNGSCASGIYTIIYFTFSSLILLIYVIDEWDYLMGRHQKPKGETIIEKGDVTETHVIFNIIVLICSVCLVVSSIIMLYGLRTDKRQLLLPWILLMIGDVCVELVYAIYFILGKRANFDPIVGFIFTIDLFVVCLNTYCLLCVVSQYQAYKEILKRANQQRNIAGAIETNANRFCDNIAVTELSIPNKRGQLNRPTTHLLKSQHCPAIAPIAEENASDENSFGMTVKQ